MGDWRDKIRNPKCKLCDLHKSADYVCLMGSGPKKARVMVVGEAPGAREDESHQSFVGPAGKLLRELLSEVGISPEECYITNTAKCRPPDNRAPELPELKACVNEYLLAEIRKVRPDWILLLGNSALRGVVGRSGITKYRGQSFPISESTTAFATFHPAYALRNPKHLEPLRADLKRFSRMVRGEPTEERRTKAKIVRTKSGLRALREHLLRSPEISFDLETSYDVQRKVYHSPWDPGAAIVSIAFSTSEGTGYFVPLWHAESPWIDSWQRVVLYLKPALENRQAKLIAHNGKFDAKWLAQFGVYIRLTFDTMLAGHLLDENRLKGLESLASILLGMDEWKFDLKNAHNEPLRKLGFYNCKDTDATLRLYHYFKAQLKEQPRLGKIMAWLMMPASDVLTQVESVGMYVRQKQLRKQREHARRERDRVLEKLRKHVPEYARDRINFNSTQQLAHWLFTDLGLPILETTAKGAPSSKESVLLQLAKQHKAPKLLLEYRAWKKQLEFLESWSEKIDARGRIHTNYLLFGTVTGRLSSREPNLQQVPREGSMRSVFGAPKGWYFVEADYSQIELRVAAMLSADRALLRAFATGEDVHLKTASETSGKSPDTITKEERKKAKAVNFGFLYGMGASKFVTYARDNYDVEVTQAEAERVRERFFQTYTELRPWHARQRRRVDTYGQVTSPLGRVRHLPDVRSGDKGVAAEAERQAINSPVQSFASDLMLLSLVRLNALLPSRDARIVGTVHDALLFEVREEAIEQVLPQIKSVMEDMATVERMFGCEVDVPIEVEVTYGKWWGQTVEQGAKEWE